MFDNFISKKVVVFFDDGSVHDNVKRKSGTFLELKEGLVVIEEDNSLVQMIIPLTRVVRIEQNGG